MLRVSALYYSIALLSLTQPQAAAQRLDRSRSKGCSAQLESRHSTRCAPGWWHRVCRLWKVVRTPHVLLRLVRCGVRDWRIRAAGAGAEHTRRGGGRRQGLGARHPGELVALQGRHCGVYYREPRRWSCSALSIVASQSIASPAIFAHILGGAHSHASSSRAVVAGDVTRRLSSAVVLLHSWRWRYAARPGGRRRHCPSWW